MIPTKFWIYIATVDDEDAEIMYKMVQMPYQVKAGDTIELLAYEEEDAEPVFQKTSVYRTAFNVGAMCLTAQLIPLGELLPEEFTETVEGLTAAGWLTEK